MKNKQRKGNSITFSQFLGIFRDIQMPWLLMLAAFALQLTSYFVTIQLTYITGNIVDSTGLFNSDTLISYVLTTAGAALLSVFVYPLQSIACEKINLGLRQRLWKKIIHLPQSCYAEDRGETLVSRITSDCDYASTLFTVVISVFTMVIGLVMYIDRMYRFNVSAANIILLAFLPCSILMGWLFGKLQYLVSKKGQKKLSDSTVYLVERTKNLNLVRATNMQSTEEDAGNRCFKAQYLVSLQQGLVGCLSFASTSLLSFLSLLITVLFGSLLIEKGLATAGAVISFYMIAGNVSGTFSSFIGAFGSIRQAMGALERVVTTLETPDEDLETGDTIDFPDADIRFENVDFSYRSNAQVLKQLSCCISKNEVTAIIGANGSGKSTLLKLLSRLYEPDSGVIYFGEDNIADYSRHAWRRAVGIVSQDCPLLEGTLRENILYGCDHEVSDNVLYEVCRKANLENLLQTLPDGLDTHVLSGGSNFSGGQRQCIAIARAMMRNPDYLLLDEATSNLDPKSERIITDALHNLMKGRTTIIIAHKLSALRYADHVIVVKEGRVIQKGCPGEIFPDWKQQPDH